MCVFQPKKAEEDTCRVKKVTGNTLLTESLVRQNTQPDFKNQKTTKTRHGKVEMRLLK